jgi:hypothetical protein
MKRRRVILIVVPALMKSHSETISDSDARIRAFSRMALGQFGPDASQQFLC